MKIGGAVFGGAFFIAGLAIFYFFVASIIFESFHMRTWQATPATLNHASIHTYESRNDDGSYTTMYSLDIEYEYWAQGRHHLGTRADISGHSNSDSTEHYQRLYKIKKEHAQKTLRVWVNPNDSNQSIYDRSVNIRTSAMMSLFSFIFMFVGSGIAYASKKEQSMPPLTVKPNPNKPWTTRSEWASSTLYSNAKSKLGYIKFFGILSVLFFGMFAIGLVGKSTMSSIFACLLCLPSFFLYRWYHHKKMEWNFFKAVPVELNPYPGMIGGTVAGSILVPTPYHAGDKYTFTLKCTHHTVTRSGNTTSHHSNLVWSKKYTPTPKAKLNGTYLNFNFKVPADQPESSEPDNNYHRWTLYIKSELTGINFNRDYEVPVFVTDQSQTVEDELLEQPLSASNKADLHSRLSINQQNKTFVTGDIPSSSEQTNDQYLSFKTPGSNTGWYIAGIGALFFIIGTAIAISGETSFGIAFSAIATVFILLGTYALGRNCLIRVSPNRIEIDVYLFTKLVNQHVLSSTDVREIQPHKSSSTSKNGVQVNEQYGIRVFTTDNKFVDMGGEFKSMKNATHIKQEIERIFTG